MAKISQKEMTVGAHTMFSVQSPEQIRSSISLSLLDAPEAVGLYDTACHQAKKEGRLLHESNPALAAAFVRYFKRWHKNMAATHSAGATA